MEDRNEISLEGLKEIYKAQTEAYLDFNLALITIVSNQQELLSKVENLQDLSDTEFKNLVKEYYALEKLMTGFQNSQLFRDQNLNNTIEENTAQMSHFGAEFSNLKRDINTKIDSELVHIKDGIKDVKSLQWQIKNEWNKLKLSMGVVLLLLTLLQLFTGKGLMDFLK